MTPAKAFLGLLAGSWLALATAAALGHPAHDHGPGPAAPAALDPSFDYVPPAPGSYRLPVLAHAAGGRLLDEYGHEVELAELLDGAITVVAFVYTRCADVCPLALMALAEVHAATRDAGLDAQLITLSFDPAHDTPEIMAMLARGLRDDEGAPWHFLTAADEAAIRPVLAAWDQTVIGKDDPDDLYGPLAHVLRVTLVDRERRIRNIYNQDFLDPRLMLGDIRTLLLEEQIQAVRR